MRPPDHSLFNSARSPSGTRSRALGRERRMPTVRKGRKPPLLRRVRKVGVHQPHVQSEERDRERQEGNRMEEEVTPLVTPPWIASPWLLSDVRYLSRCPV